MTVHTFLLARTGRAIIVDKQGRAAWWLGEPSEIIHPYVKAYLDYTGRRSPMDRPVSMEDRIEAASKKYLDVVDEVMCFQSKKNKRTKTRND